MSKRKRVIQVVKGLRYEDFSIHKYPKKGKCKNTCFANGNHRVGLVPTMSLMDGGASGVTAKEICLECKKWFKKTVFYIKCQPSRFPGVTL